VIVAAEQFSDRHIW